MKPAHCWHFHQEDWKRVFKHQNHVISQRSSTGRRNSRWRFFGSHLNHIHTGISSTELLVFPLGF
jgi:hypothetical protein